MKGKVQEILISEERIQERVRQLAGQINRDFAGEELFGICLLKGSLLFTSDLIRHLELPVTVDTMQASSYLGTSTTSSGSVKILSDLDQDIADRNVLIIEDIVDTGRTLKKIIELLRVRHPKTLRVCTLLDKPSKRIEDIEIHYRGFTIEDRFVIGYGLDYDDYYRNLPYIGILDPEG